MNSTTLTMRIPFDTLAYAKKLKNAGVSEEVAEIQAEALAEVINERIATKQDLKELELRLAYKITNSTYKLTISLGSMIAAGIMILSVISKLH